MRINLALAKLSLSVAKLWQRWFNYKTVALGLSITLLLSFGDVLIPLLLHSLHVVIAVVEVFLEHILEQAFDLTPRQAQFVLAYSGLLLMVVLALQLLKKLYQTCLECYARLQQLHWPTVSFIACGLMFSYLYLLM